MGHVAMALLLEARLPQGWLRGSTYQSERLKQKYWKKVCKAGWLEAKDPTSQDILVATVGCECNFALRRDPAMASVIYDRYEREGLDYSSIAGPME